MKDSLHQRRDSGFTLPELLVYISVVAVAGVWLATQFGNITAGADLERAFVEIEKVRTAAAAYRSSSRRAGLYTGISVTSLATQGYNVKPLITGTNQNVYGKSIAIAPAASNADATLTYAASVDSACQQLIERYTGVAGVKSVPTCAADVLTLTLE